VIDARRQELKAIEVELDAWGLTVRDRLERARWRLAFSLLDFIGHQLFLAKLDRWGRGSGVS
jgi:hypothetical protein